MVFLLEKSQLTGYSHESNNVKYHSSKQEDSRLGPYIHFRFEFTDFVKVKVVNGLLTSIYKENKY
jgi:hypothetical protein